MLELSLNIMSNRRRLITVGFPELIMFMNTSILPNLPTLWGKLITWLWLVEPREVRPKSSHCLYIHQLEPIPNPITVRLIMIISAEQVCKLIGT